MTAPNAPAAPAADGWGASSVTWEEYRRYGALMADLTIWHNPNCSTSKYALAAADEAGVEYDLRKYMLKSERPSRAEIVELIKQVEDPATDLVRRDAKFKKYGLSDADVSSDKQVADVLEEHPELLQRPILVIGKKAIIGRPKDRVPEFLS